MLFPMRSNFSLFLCHSLRFSLQNYLFLYRFHLMWGQNFLFLCRSLRMWQQNFLFCSRFHFFRPQHCVAKHFCPYQNFPICRSYHQPS